MSIRALHRFPSSHLGSLSFHLSRGCWTIRGGVGLVLEAYQGLLGFLEFLVCVSHTPAHGQRIALDDRMDDMEKIRHAQAL